MEEKYRFADMLTELFGWCDDDKSMCCNVNILIVFFYVL